MNRPLITVNKIILHHSATPRDLDFNASINSFNTSHKMRLHPEPNGFGMYIAYHYVIGGNGELKATRPVDEVGYHASNWIANLTSIGICLCGNFDLERPTMAQMKTLRDLIAKIKKERRIKPDAIFGHRKFAPKTCPGKNFTDRMIGEISVGVINRSTLELVKITNIEDLKNYEERDIVRIGKEIYAPKK